MRLDLMFWKVRYEQLRIRHKAQTRELRQHHRILRESQLARSRLHGETLMLRQRVQHLEDLLTQISVAVGRVKVLEGMLDGRFESLPEVVGLVAADHDDLEGRIDAIVEYLKHLDMADWQIAWQDVRENVGKLLQGAEPEIVDLQGGIDIKEE